MFRCTLGDSDSDDQSAWKVARVTEETLADGLKRRTLQITAALGVSAGNDECDGWKKRKEAPMPLTS
eukprot:scaffold3941_cov201-Alexandrium_tamarense.AAC.4